MPTIPFYFNEKDGCESHTVGIVTDEYGNEVCDFLWPNNGSEFPTKFAARGQYVTKHEDKPMRMSKETARQFGTVFAECGMENLTFNQTKYLEGLSSECTCPDLVVMEESPVYAAFCTMAGLTVGDGNENTELYNEMRAAMIIRATQLFQDWREQRAAKRAI